MSNEMQDIDNLFKEAIEPYEFSPSANAWNNIEKKLQQKSVNLKERTIKNLRITLGLLAASFSLFVAYHYYAPTTETKIAKNVQPEIKNNSAVISSPEKSNENIVSDKTEQQTKQDIAPVLAAKTEQNIIADDKVVSKGNQPNEQKVFAGITNTRDESAKNTEDADDKQQIHKFSPSVIEKEAKENILLSEDHAKKKENSSAQNIQTDATKKKESEVALAAAEKENIVYVPNAFTPNGDGLNDVFLPKATEEPKEYKLYVFDCKGNTVFFSDDFNKGWDGKVQLNGIETVKEDAYLWRIEFKNSGGEKERAMGYITLLK